MLWLKAFHVVFVVTWFAGLFYLPRLFVYHAAASEREGLARFVVMERRLFLIMSLGALLAVLCGAAMIVSAPGYLTAPTLAILSSPEHWQRGGTIFATQSPRLNSASRRSKHPWSRLSRPSGRLHQSQ